MTTSRGDAAIVEEIRAEVGEHPLVAKLRAQGRL